jgi:hypothetical protein
VSGIVALVVSNAAAFAAEPKAKQVVRAALAEMASIEERLIRVLSMTVAMSNGSRRLTAAPEAGAVNANYVITLPPSAFSTDSMSNRVAAALRNASPDEVARKLRVLIQAEGLPYAVDVVNVSSTVDRLEDEPCGESAEGEGSLRGSHSRRNCGPGSSDNKDSFALVAGMWLGASLLLLSLCVGVAVCVYMRMRTPKGPKVMVVEGAPCTGSAAKAAPSPAQGAVVDSNEKTNNNNSNNNNNNDIVIGHVVPEAL